MKTVPAYIIPYNKPDSSNNNQRHYHQIHQPVVIVIHQRAIRTLTPHEIKSRVAKGGNGMENPKINSLKNAVLWNKPNG